ncbi:MAG: tRNA pseudouridine(38-40) synthase TruA [Magnetospirillum sp. WYHS-4]
MPRYRITVEYDGSGFVGWQRQAAGASVQQTLEEAVARFAGTEVRLHVAGRTDAGVHALGQVAHFDLEKDWPPDKVRDALNYWVKPRSIAVLRAEVADAGFHARFSAVERTYLYRILNRRAPPALDRDRVWWVSAPLNAETMAEAARELLGRHDFTTFRAALCQANSPVRTLDQLEVSRRGEEIHVVARARSFLHHQVRNMVGTLKLVGEGKWTPADVRRALEARDRAQGGPTAPASGLYLTGVGY